MPLYRTQFVLETADNVAANYATNTWYCTAGNETELLGFNSAVLALYGSVASQFGNMMKATSQIKWKSYDMNDPEPRAPVLEASSTINPDNTNTLPAEVAMVLSFQAVKVSGSPQARRRGRIYLPFLKSSLNGADGRPTATIITAMATAADTLVTASKASTTWKWVVYSPTDNAGRPVTDGWVDNEWDTQRRRGRVRTSRTLFS